MKIFNKINAHIAQNKESILKNAVNMTKVVLFLGIFPIIVLSLNVPYHKVLRFFGDSTIIFLTLQLLYFVFVADSPQRNKIMYIWKVFFGIVSLMFIFMFSMDRYVKNVETDYYKTKISYQLTNKMDASETFNKYETLIQTELNSSFYQAEEAKDILESILDRDREHTNEQKPYKIFYTNFALLIMLVMAYFMFLWSVTAIYEMRNEKKKDKSELPNYKKRINEKKKILRARMIKK